MSNLGGGLAVALAASSLFGSYLVFVKKYDVGDGVFFQFFMCVGVFVVGVLVNVVRGAMLCVDTSTCIPPFFIPIAMVGGLLWTTANMLTTFIIRRTGLGLGLLLWASVQMLVGWSTGFFGLFGITKANISAPGLNIAGVAIAVSALVVYVLIALKPHRGGAPPPWKTSGWEKEKLMPADASKSATYSSGSGPDSKSSAYPQPQNSHVAPLALALRNEVAISVPPGGSLQSPEPDSDASPVSAAVTQVPAAARRFQSMEYASGEDEALESSARRASQTYDDDEGFRSDRWLTAPAPGKKPLPHRTRMMSGAAGSPFVTSADDDDAPHSNGIWNSRLLGALAALLAGALRGTNMVPPESELDQHHHTDALGRHVSSVDVVFPHFCGILLSSTLFTAVYVLLKKNKPYINPKVALPAIVSGMMFGVAQTLWFIANDMLSFALSFPIITTLPGLIGALWSIFVFKEISGKKNFILLAIAFGLAIFAGIMIALSH